MRSVRRRVLFGVAALASFGLVASTVVFYVFTGRSNYDDEGYILVSLRGWISGHALYDRVYSQYGPGFYAAVGGVPRVFGHAAISLEASRGLTVLIGLATAIALGVAAAKISRSPAAGLLAAVFVALTSPLGIEASLHPTHVVGLLVALTVLGVALLDDAPRSRVALVLVGASVAIALLVKVNAGALLALGTASGLGLLLRGRPVRQRLVIPVAAALLAAAAVGLGDYHSPFVTLLAAAAVVGIVSAPRGNAATPPSRNFLVVTTAATGLFIVVIALGTGTSIGGLVSGVLYEPAHLAHAFTVIMRGGGKTVIALLVVLTVGLIDRRLPPLGQAVVRVGAGITLLDAAHVIRIGSGIDNHNVNMLVLGASLGWVLLRTSERPVPSSRVVLCSLAMLLPLEAYPVAGGQRMAGAILFSVIGAIAFADGARLIGDNYPEVTDEIQQAVAVGLIAVALVASISAFADARIARRGTVPLGTMSAHGIRTGSIDATEVVDVTIALRKCTAFYGMPGLNTFYLTTGMEPPTWQNTGTWMTLFDTKRQAKVVRDLKRVDGLCVLRNREIEGFWLGGGHEIHGPLRPYLESFTTLVAKVDNYEIYRAAAGA